MAGDLNRVMVMGRVGGAPKALKTKGGVSLSRFDLATSRRVRKEGEEGFSEETVWHRVVVWGRQGEACQEFVTKGQRLFVEGELRTRSYEASDGTSRTVVEIHANQVSFLERPRDQSGVEKGAKNAVVVGSSDAGNPTGDLMH